MGAIGYTFFRRLSATIVNSGDEIDRMSLTWTIEQFDDFSGRLIFKSEQGRQTHNFDDDIRAVKRFAGRLIVWYSRQKRTYRFDAGDSTL